MYVENIWGIFFCMYLPILLTIYGAYKAGIEDGKRKIVKTQKRKNRRKNYVSDKTRK